MLILIKRLGALRASGTILSHAVLQAQPSKKHSDRRTPCTMSAAAAGRKSLTKDIPDKGSDPVSTGKGRTKWELLFKWVHCLTQGNAAIILTPPWKGGGGTGLLQPVREAVTGHEMHERWVAGPEVPCVRRWLCCLPVWPACHAQFLRGRTGSSSPATCAPLHADYGQTDVQMLQEEGLGSLSQCDEHSRCLRLSAATGLIQ